jgi:hypothetical protein
VEREDQNAVCVKPLPSAQRARILRKLGMPLGLADNCVPSFNPAADVVPLEGQHPGTQFARRDHAVETTAPDTGIHKARVLDLLDIIMEETTQLLPLDAGLERLYQLDDERLLITDVHLVAGHVAFPSPVLGPPDVPACRGSRTPPGACASRSGGNQAQAAPK